jgi:hypothetical protein
MKIGLVATLGACFFGLLAPMAPVHSASIASTNTVPEIRIVSQPFNVLNSSNTRFVLDPNLNSIVDRTDRLEFLLHRRISTADSFRAIARGEVQSSVTDSLTINLSRVDRDYAGHLLPVVPIIIEEKDGFSLSIPFDGIYPITIRLVDSQTDAVLSEVLTFVNKRDPNGVLPPVPFTTLLHLQAEPSLTSNGDIEISDATRAAVQRTIDFLASHPTQVTVSIEPEVIAALAESANPSDAKLFLALREQLRTRSIANATFAPVDPSLFAGLNLSREFSSQLAFGEKTLNRLLPGVTIQRSVFVAQHRLDDAGVALLRKSGITSIFLMSAAQTDTTSEKSPYLLAHPSTKGSESSAVISPFSTDFAPSIAASKKDAYRIAAAVLVERDDLLAAGNDPAMIRLALPIDVANPTRSDSAITASMTLAATLGIADVDMSLPQTVDGSTPAINFGRAPTKWDTSRVPSINAARTELTAVDSMLDEGDLRRNIWPALLGIGTSTAVENPGIYISSLRKKLRATRAAVTVTTPTKLTLSSRNGFIRVQIRNNSTDDLIVRVRLASAKLTLTDPSRVITLTAGGTTEVSVSAVTRTSGAFPISVWVSTPVGNAEVVPLITITANVTAIAGFGQLISISFLLVLLAWWWSNRRSARREADEPTTVLSQ